MEILLDDLGTKMAYGAGPCPASTKVFNSLGHQHIKDDLLASFGQKIGRFSIKIFMWMRLEMANRDPVHENHRMSP